MLYREPGKPSWAEPGYNLKPDNHSLGKKKIFYHFIILLFYY